MTYSPTRDYSAKFQFMDSQKYYEFLIFLTNNEFEGIYNIRLYEVHETKILFGNKLADEQGYDIKKFYVVMDIEIPKHYGARTWLKERFEIEPQVCWFHYWTLLNKNPLEILEDEL